MADGFVFADPESPPDLQPQAPPHSWRSWGVVIAAAVVWWLAYQSIAPLAHWLTYSLLGLPHNSRFGRVGCLFSVRCPQNPVALERYDLSGINAAHLL